MKYNRYRVSYLWTWGTLEKIVVGFTETDAEETFLNHMYNKYGETAIEAAAFKIVSIEKIEV